MDDVLIAIAVSGFFFGCIYKVFELIVGRKERLMLIDKLQAEQLGKGVAGHLKSSPYFTTLRTGFLMLGIGIGLVVGYGVSGHVSMEESSIIYAACALIGGGLGLVAAFLVEHKMGEKSE